MLRNDRHRFIVFRQLVIIPDEAAKLVYLFYRLLLAHAHLEPDGHPTHRNARHKRK